MHNQQTKTTASTASQRAVGVSVKGLGPRKKSRQLLQIGSLSAFDNREPSISVWVNGCTYHLLRRGNRFALTDSIPCHGMRFACHLNSRSTRIRHYQRTWCKYLRSSKTKIEQFHGIKCMALSGWEWGRCARIIARAWRIVRLSIRKLIRKLAVQTLGHTHAQTHLSRFFPSAA